MTANPVTIAMNPAAWALPAGHTRRREATMMRPHSPLDLEMLWCQRHETSTVSDWALYLHLLTQDDRQAIRHALDSVEPQTETLSSETRAHIRTQIRSHLTTEDQT